jgi:hypothetical protein
MTPLLALGLLIAALALRMSVRPRRRAGAARSGAVPAAARAARQALSSRESAQLRGARARVHAIVPAPEPAAELSELPDLLPPPAHTGQRTRASVWRYLDLSIELVDCEDAVPGDGGPALTLWDPGALALIAFAADAAPAAVDSVDVMQGGRWVPLEGDRVLGGQRVRLHASLPTTFERLELCYGPERLGDLRDPRGPLPAPRAGDRTSVS